VSTPAEPRSPRLLITAGPTQEPIDAVRYIGNRSSGRLGCALADRAAARGWPVTLLLGPAPARPASDAVTLRRFRTTDDLARLLDAELPSCDILVMAAAVADYRPAIDEVDLTEKRRRGGNLTLRLEATPDLLAACGSRRTPSQLLVGFALEPRDRLLDSARSKLARKKIDLVVANPLETMDAPTIDATLLGTAATGLPEQGISTGNAIAKTDFADWLLDRLAPLAAARLAGAHARAASQ
jgi:phosphopantothenoylcysteine decarboxylase/phosphopantothenate--cysteine ligase